MTLSDDVPIITEPTEERLLKRQCVDFRRHRVAVLEWLAALGKTPDRGEGYSDAVFTNTACRLDQFYRWVWDQRCYTTSVSHDDADAYLRDLAGRDCSNAHRSACLKALNSHKFE